MSVTRCAWPGDDPLMIEYHDREWGTATHDDRKHFEFLVLEAAQAGLSWRTVLYKREGYRTAFADFDPAQVAAFGDEDVARLLDDPGIVRNRAKVGAAIGNARAWLALDDPVEVLWSFVGGAPVQNRYERMEQLPAETDASRAMSRELRRLGFRFVGPTICYALMQATGMVNDHQIDCIARQAPGRARRKTA